MSTLTLETNERYRGEKIQIDTEKTGGSLPQARSLDEIGAEHARSCLSGRPWGFYIS